MSSNSEAPKPNDQPPEAVSRRGFLKGSGAIVGGFAAGFLTGKYVKPETQTAANPSTAEPAGVPTPEPTRHLEKFPGIDFKPISFGNEPIQGSLKKGPQGFWFKAQSGVRVETLTNPLDHDVGFYIKSALYSQNGTPVETDADTRIAKTIPESDLYFVVVSKSNPNSPGNNFEISARNERDHNMQTRFVLYPGKKPIEIIPIPELLTILQDGDANVVIDFNDELMDKQVPVKAYAMKDTPKAKLLNLAEEDPKNEIPVSVETYEDNKLKIKSKNGQFPTSSQVAIKVGTSYFVRFFTL